MLHSQLYQAIFHRKSTRKYDLTPLPVETLAKLREYAAKKVSPLSAEFNYRLSWLSTDDVKNLLPIKAPHYLCLYAEQREGYLINAGYLLQQIDLYLSASGLGSCWLGLAKPFRQIPQEQDGLSFVITLAFGRATEQVHRADVTEFNRKSQKAISDIAGASELLEPVRLAPSATNSQPWFFSGTVDEIIVCRKQLNRLQAPLYERMNQIDIGIALCHLVLSYEQQGKRVVCSFDPAPAPSGYQFMARVRVVN